MYVDRVVRGSRSVDRDFFTLVNWNTSSLNAREKEEMGSGRFGDGYIDPRMEERIDTSYEVFPSPSDNPSTVQSSNMIISMKKSPPFYSSPKVNRLVPGFLLCIFSIFSKCPILSS